MHLSRLAWPPGVNGEHFNLTESDRLCVERDSVSAAKSVGGPALLILQD